ncbi:MAG: hypothetical protein ACYSR5_12035 [Planctomycetota bacterium]|jgi:hypothetical protein
MAMWIFVAVFGVLVSLIGFCELFSKYRRGDIGGRYMVAFIVGFIFLAAWALLTNLRPNAIDTLVDLAILAPVLVAIVVIIRERQTTHYK